ncbi:MAG: SAM-dependent chlorinase/fluorinase [Candidatus Falkowbacteria bacterium]|nr:SAM-dependent chlorinase/fluorinase [Candidatus Falkowbacteria bacterium]
MDKNIVIVTDCSDIALEQIKARLTFLLPNNRLNFFNVIVSPFQINNGLFLSKLISDEIHHGRNTLFLAIVNPLKEKPKRIFGRLKNGTWFVSADTGIFSFLFKEFGIEDVYEGKEQCHIPFGGLHMHTVIAGKLLRGDSEEKLGSKISESNIKKIFPRKGEVLHIDNFGLIKIWNRTGDFDFFDGGKVKLKVVNSSKTLDAIFSNRMMNFEDNTLVVYPGSSLLDKSKINSIEEYIKSGLIEIGLVRDPDSAKKLGVNLGDIIEIEKN